MPSSTDLADAGAGEQAHALAAADGQQRVDRAHADVEHLVYRLAIERIDDRRGQRRVGMRAERAESVERTAGRVEHASEQFPADRQTLGARHRIGDRRAFERIDTRAGQQADHFGGRHQKQFVAGEADDFGFGHRQRTAGRQFDHHFGAHRQAQADGFEHEAGGARQTSAGAQRLRDRIARAQRIEAAAPSLHVRIGVERGIVGRVSSASRACRRGIAAGGGARRRMGVRRIAQRGFDGGHRGRCGCQPGCQRGRRFRRRRIRCLRERFGAERRQRQFAFERRQIAGADLFERRLHHVLTLPSAAATRSQRVSMPASTSPVPACARQPPRSTDASVRTVQPRVCSSSIR